MLDLVDDRALAQLREEAAGVRLGKVALVGHLQVRVPFNRPRPERSG